MISQTESLHSDQLLDELIDEIFTRLQRGEQVQLDELINKHPAMAERIKTLLPTLQALAELDPSRSESLAPGAWAGSQSTIPVIVASAPSGSARCTM